jgi:hypothetical protein
MCTIHMVHGSGATPKPDHSCALLEDCTTGAGTGGVSDPAGILISPRMTSDHYTTSLVGSLQVCCAAPSDTGVLHPNTHVRAPVSPLRTYTPEAFQQHETEGTYPCAHTCYQACKWSTRA